jgi:hypothetical protein
VCAVAGRLLLAHQLAAQSCAPAAEAFEQRVARRDSRRAVVRGRDQGLSRRDAPAISEPRLGQQLGTLGRAFRGASQAAGEGDVELASQLREGSDVPGSAVLDQERVTEELRLEQVDCRHQPRLVVVMGGERNRYADHRDRYGQGGQQDAEHQREGAQSVAMAGGLRTRAVR